MSDPDPDYARCKAAFDDITAVIARFRATEIDYCARIENYLEQEVNPLIQPGVGMVKELRQVQAAPTDDKDTIVDDNDLIDRDEDEPDEEEDGTEASGREHESSVPSNQTDEVDFNIETAVADLRTWHDNEIVPKNELKPVDLSEIDFLRPGIVPKPSQLYAAAAIARARTSCIKGLLHFDGPGSGKTLSAIIAMVASRKPGDPPDIVVAPSSVCPQWRDEFANLVQPNKVRVLYLQTSDVSPFDLWNYDVVIVSHTHMSRELARLIAYYDRIVDYEAGKARRLLPRPHTPLLSNINRYGKGWGKYLILDESHTIRNAGGRTYEAIKLLRDMCETCICLTGTPIENTWKDLFVPFSLFKGHQITTMDRAELFFVGPRSKKKKTSGAVQYPKGIFLTRLIEFLDAVSICRPDEVAETLPAKHVHMIDFELPNADNDCSNAFFEAWKASLGTRGPYASRRYFSDLTKAHQAAMHPNLLGIMDLIRRAYLARQEAGGVMTKKAQQELDAWKADMRVTGEWRSARIDAILEIVQEMREHDPTATIIIMEESVFFLDIVELALVEGCPYPPEVWRYDGRSTSDEVHPRLKEFKASLNFKILLTTCGTGGLGLNLQFSNHLIICSQWWRQSSVDNAIGKIFRNGQTKETRIVILRANPNSVESHRMHTRQTRDRQNKAITTPVKRVPGGQLVRRRIELDPLEATAANTTTLVD